METIKTAVVVTCLLGVLYGVYTILNKPDAAPPPEVAAAFESGEVPNLDIDFGASDFSDGGDFTGDSGFAGPDTSAAQYPAPNESMLGYDNTGYDNTGYDNTGDDTGPPPAPAIEPYDPNTSEPVLDNGYNPTASVEVVPQPSLAQPSIDGGYAPQAPSLEPALPSTEPVQPLVDPQVADPYSLSNQYTTEGNNPLAADNDGPPSGADSGEAPPLQAAPPLQTADISATEPVTTLPDTPAETTSGVGTEEAPLRPFERARRSALAQIEGQQLRQALFTLSLFYNDPQLTEAEHQQLLDLLDPLAGRVIYSREHLLTSAHVTTQGEDLEAVAAKYQVPAKLLANINGIQRPDAMTSGMELKVVPGPFRADVDLTKGELTLFVQRLYAGRFPIAVGNDPSPREGEYTVKDKQPGQTYYSAAGSTVAAGSATNPYGSHWLDLGGLSVHGSPQTPSNISQGCISLSPRDAADVYQILTVGAKVNVRR